MIYVYRRNASDSARVLAETLNGFRYRGARLPIELRVRQGDVVVSWGETVGAVPEGVRVLNGTPIRSKFEDAMVLHGAGVPTVEVSRTRPVARVTQLADPALLLWHEAQQIAEDFVNLEADDQVTRNEVTLTGIRQLRDAVTRLTTAMEVPIPTTQEFNGEWLPRTNDHAGGTDLLTPPEVPGFWVRRETLVNEFRVHSFLGRSIRAGQKVPREGMTAHEWVRSWDAGWRLSYADGLVRQVHRDLAHAAVAALGLQFGAVDIGQREDGTLLVLEVNRAPGLEGGTIEKYASAVQRWIEDTPAQTVAA